MTGPLVQHMGDDGVAGVNMREKNSSLVRKEQAGQQLHLSAVNTLLKRAHENLKPTKVNKG